MKQYPNWKESEVETVTKYFVKWLGWSHIHNTWDTAEDLKFFKGFKKLENYMKTVKAHQEWRLTASPEELEPIDIAREVQREQRETWTKVDRVLDIR